MTIGAATATWARRHLLDVDELTREDLEEVLGLAVELRARREAAELPDPLLGVAVGLAFYEASTRTQSSFELAGKRLGADVMNMSVASSSVKKGETLIDTAITLNAMRPDILIIRHQSAGAAALLAQKVGCAVVNAGDGQIVFI